MKKLLALVLAVMLTFSLGVMAFAADNVIEDQTLVGTDGTKRDPDKNFVPGATNRYLVEIINTSGSKATTTVDFNAFTIVNPSTIAITAVAAPGSGVEVTYTTVTGSGTGKAWYAKNAKYGDAPVAYEVSGMIIRASAVTFDSNGKAVVTEAAPTIIGTPATTATPDWTSANANINFNPAAISLPTDAIDEVTLPSIMDAVSAWKAYDTDKAFKVNVKFPRGDEYVKSWTLKKDNVGQMYIEVVMQKYYLAGMPDIDMEVKLTVTNAAKFEARASSAWTSLKNWTPYARNDVIEMNLMNYKYGFNASNLWSVDNKNYKNPSTLGTNETNPANKAPGVFNVSGGDLKAGIVDFTVPANLGSNNTNDGTGSNPDRAGYIHYSGGKGDVYSFDFDKANAYFEVKMDNQPNVNLYLETSAIKALTAAYPNADMVFYNWLGKPDFDFTATVELYVSEDDVGKTPILYSWDGENLKEVTSATYADETITFKTRNLGAYVVSNVELDAAVVAPSTTAGEATEATDAPADGDATTTTKTVNPGTGASDFVGVAVALAVVSLAAAGAVALKK